ncbi:60S ribosomal protein L5-1 [Capsicum baccatum]|uniref:60S ribosomal protein L5-1 n=1 Tax=Capsicum baccatum TaxID=33114 RepID=A0A2G2W624_CAPBA|nr:60S ribosomal protein L5-1 [Capsicum baccatum]
MDGQEWNKPINSDAEHLKASDWRHIYKPSLIQDSSIDVARDSFNNLVNARYVERCPAPEPFLKPPSEEKTVAKKRGAKSAKALMEDEPEKYQSHFSVYLKLGLEPDSIEEMYKKVHVAIRAYPSPKKSGKQPPKQHKRYNLKKLTYEERKDRLIKRLNALNATGGNDDDDEKDDD